MVARSNSATDGYLFYIGVGDINFGIKCTGQSFRAKATSLPTLGVWTHYIMTWGSNNIELFVNNVSAGTQSTTGTITNYTTDLILGANSSDTSSSRLNGALDDVRIYDRVLTATERAAIYAYTEDASSSSSSV